ncbi:MAG: hypothetical protein GY850_32565, partial [bacterium]|nr:hypothetical protein [bacterium]
VIQWAIDDAEEGDDLVLDPGTYAGIGNRDIRFRGKAVTLRSEDPDDPAIVASTIIDGGGIWAFRLLDDEDHTSVLSGLTITNGSNGVYCSQSSPTITDCVITGNDGRGIYLRNSDALITDCTFVGNGGGLEISVGNPEVTDCIFIGNQADRGGAISISSSSEIVISGCTMTGNSAGIEGGAVRGSANGGLIIEACSISGNTALEKGGGLYVYGTVNVVNTTITGNTAGQGGGIYTPICSPRITNCTLSENRASDSGGGICFFGSTAEITNTILWNNSAQSSGPEMALLAHFSSYFPTTVLTSYCDVLGGESSVFVENTNCTLTWQNSMDADPSFVDPGSWDDRGTTDNLSDDIWNEGVYRLTAGSPCIDAGTSDEAPDMDCEGNGRYDDPSTEDTGGGAFTFYDIGAFEFGGGPIFCPADLEGDDNDVDGSDLAVLANDPALLDLASFAEKFGTSVCLP